MKIIIDLAAQTLRLLDAQQHLVKQYPVSTAAAGIGEQQGSMQTPRGLHVIRACIGADLPAGAVLRGRRPTGEIHTPALAAQHPERDWILSRILWLSGCQPGFNRLGEVDSMRRYVYIHGTPDDQPMGIPASHGCVRMRNHDVIDLFGRVTAGTQVLIIENDSSLVPPPQVRRIPASCIADLWRRLLPLTLPLPKSPVPLSNALPACALWRFDGELLGVARLVCGGSVEMAGTASGQGEGWSSLLEAISQNALDCGWQELRMAATQSPSVKMAEGAGFVVLRAIPGLKAGVLLRKPLMLSAA